MNFSRRFSSYLGFALMLCLLSFAPTPSLAACKNSGGQVGANTYGSQVSGGSVKICANAIAVSPARTAVVKTPVKVVASPQAKPAATKKAVFRKQPNLVTVQTVVQKVVAKTPVIAKAKPKPKTKPKATVITKPGSKNVTATSAIFTPAAVVARVYPANALAPGQLATFTSSAIEHFRTGTLLSSRTQVRFSPLAIEWDFGDGYAGMGDSVSYVYEQEGQYGVQLNVTYQVAYRPMGSTNWIIEPQTIQTTDDLLVQVSASADLDPIAPTRETNRVLLVGESCFARPGSFGCN